MGNTWHFPKHVFITSICIIRPKYIFTSWCQPEVHLNLYSKIFSRKHLFKKNSVRFMYKRGSRKLIFSQKQVNFDENFNPKINLFESNFILLIYLRTSLQKLKTILLKEFIPSILKINSLKTNDNKKVQANH